MQSANDIEARAREARDARVQTVLIHHWVNQVEEQRIMLNEAARQIETLDARATRLYRDANTLSGMVTDSYAEIEAHERLAARLVQLIDRMIEENPRHADAYQLELNLAVTGFNRENPIDLTADEELDMDL